MLEAVHRSRIAVEKVARVTQKSGTRHPGALRFVHMSTSGERDQTRAKQDRHLIPRVVTVAVRAQLASSPGA